MEKVKSYREFLNENSMSRLLTHIGNHDCICITAFRTKKNCGEGEEISKKENLARNAKLKAQLLKSGYGVTAIKGVFIENFGSDNEKESKEDTFFVVDLKDSKHFKENILDYAEQYEQDSVFYIPKNEVSPDGKYTGYLISTNECLNAYPGKGKLGVEQSYKNLVISKTSEFMSKVGNKPFYFTESLEEKRISMFNGQMMTGMAMKSFSEMSIEQIMNEYSEEQLEN